MKLSLTSLVLSTAFLIQPAHADINSDCRLILDTAQQVYPEFFPDNPDTEFLGPWCFRHYDNDEFGDIYAGIFRNVGEYKKEGVYTLGGPFGDTPYYVGQTDSVIDLLNTQVSGNGNQNGICDTSGIPDGFTYREEGDTTYITTNGQCIELPENRNICETLPETDSDHKPIATGIHVLTETDVSNFEISGFDIPGVDSIAQNAVNSKVCIIHAPTELTKHTINIDVCIDITNQLGDLSAIQGANPPITTRYEGISNSTIVDDCFKTDADSISNLVTEEIWINQGGAFVKVN